MGLVSCGIVSPSKTIRGRNTSIPRKKYNGIECPLKTKIRHKTQFNGKLLNIDNAKH